MRLSIDVSFDIYNEESCRNLSIINPQYNREESYLTMPTSRVTSNFVSITNKASSKWSYKSINKNKIPIYATFSDRNGNDRGKGSLDDYDATINVKEGYNRLSMLIPKENIKLLPTGHCSLLEIKGDSDNITYVDVLKFILGEDVDILSYI
jgi:hypothetical protein